MTDDEVKAVRLAIASEMFCVEPDDVETFVKDSDYPSVHDQWKRSEKLARAVISKLDEMREADSMARFHINHQEGRKLRDRGCDFSAAMGIGPGAENGWCERDDEIRKHARAEQS